MGALFGIIAGVLVQVGVTIVTVFAKASAWNIALSVAVVVGIGSAITLLMDLIGNYVGTLVSQTSEIPFIPYFLPSNIGYCLGAFIAVKMAGTVFNASVNFIENKSYILKA